jgi:hypothetical protein
MVMFVFNILSAKELDMQMCMALLGGGMYNNGLEEFCGFKGNLSDVMKALYTEGRCRYTVPQSEVNRVAKSTVEDILEESGKVGMDRFCKENKERYYKLLGEL